MLPLCAKLEERALLAEEHMYSIMEGVVAMNDLQNPMHIEERISGKYEYDEIPDYAAADAGLALSKLRQSAHTA